MIEASGGVYSTSDGPDLVTCRWSSTPSWAKDLRFTVRKTSDSQGHNGQAVDVSGGKIKDAGHENGLVSPRTTLFFSSRALFLAFQRFSVPERISVVFSTSCSHLTTTFMARSTISSQKGVPAGGGISSGKNGITVGESSDKPFFSYLDTRALFLAFPEVFCV